MNCVCAQCLHSRETEEERGGADEEERCCWHRNVAWRSQGSAGRDYSMREGGRGWTPPSALTTTAWHHFLLVVMCVSTNCYPKSFIISLKRSLTCTERVWCAGTVDNSWKVSLLRWKREKCFTARSDGRRAGCLLSQVLRSILINCDRLK